MSRQWGFGYRWGVYTMPETVPSQGTKEWEILSDELLVKFQNNCRTRSATLLHPSWHRLIAQVSAIYNGEVAECVDGDGNLVPLPRVWHFEFQYRYFWLIELPSYLSLDQALLAAGDRRLSVLTF